MTLLHPGPAYRIHTRRLVIRCYHPADAVLLKEAIDANLEHLRPWMPWAHAEPTDLQKKIDWLRITRSNFDLSQDFGYGIFNPEETRQLGGTGLHPRIGPEALEIGYWIHKDFTRQGFATEIAAALTRVAFEVNHVRRVEIHCDPANVASAGVPAKLGFTHEAILRQRNLAADGQMTDSMIWSLLKDEYPGSPAASTFLHAYDAAGREIL
jgi:RimJ/RimL family protein N-acetyltransferase